jgi:hypothetical protein
MLKYLRNRKVVVHLSNKTKIHKLINTRQDEKFSNQPTTSKRQQHIHF